MFYKNSFKSLKIQQIYEIFLRNDDLLFSHCSNNPRVSNVFWRFHISKECMKQIPTVMYNNWKRSCLFLCSRWFLVTYLSGRTGGRWHIPMPGLAHKRRPASITLEIRQAERAGSASETKDPSGRLSYHDRGPGIGDRVRQRGWQTARGGKFLVSLLLWISIEPDGKKWKIVRGFTNTDVGELFAERDKRGTGTSSNVSISLSISRTAKGIYTV